MDSMRKVLCHKGTARHEFPAVATNLTGGRVKKNGTRRTGGDRKERLGNGTPGSVRKQTP